MRPGASVEVITYHAKLHAKQCLFGKASILACPCGTTHAITCSQCGEAVFVAAMPGTWCAHIDVAVWRG
jgi:hypothetical protein